MSNLEPGAMLGGRYRVDRLLAKGGMSEVYLGHDTQLNRSVALKVSAAGHLVGQGFVERFRREAQAAANLSHPNIVAVYDWGEADGAYFIVMEYAAGPSLAEVIAREAPLPPRRVAAIGAQIAAALAYAHRNGVVHRDVKPANVLLCAGDLVKVTDFGIAQATREGLDSRLTLVGTVLGTPAYLSPEQAEGRLVDGKSDVYSLGIVLYELATGAPPFQGQNSAAVLYQHVHQPADPPSSMNADVPPGLDAVIMLALAKDPERRPHDAQTMSDQLAALAAGRPIPPPSGFADTVADAVAGAGVGAAMEATTALPADGTRVLAPMAAAVSPPPHTPTGGTPVAGDNGRRGWVPGAIIAILVALALVAILIVALLAAAPTKPHANATSSTTSTIVARTSSTTSSTSSTTTSTSTTSSTTSTTTTSPDTFSGFQVVSGSGSSSLYCPNGIALGQAGSSPGPGSGTPAATSGTGGAAGCGSNGGNGGQGGAGAAGAAGGAGGNGGAGGCPPATLTQMQEGNDPCDGTGSNGGNGGNGGAAAAATPGGPGGTGGNGGDAKNAKGGNGGNGGNSAAGSPGGAGGAGGNGGGTNGTTAGVAGQNGAPGANG